jgi:signal transduction histidine kinase
MGDSPHCFLNDNCRKLNRIIFLGKQPTNIMKQKPSKVQAQDCIGKTLQQRTVKLTATHHQLQQEIVEGKRVETALKTSSKRNVRLLRESLQLQQGLRKLTHQVLRVQEDDRKHLSHELQDEIAQALLGINVRLLDLKQKALVDTRGLKQAITSTQRLVAKTAQSILRVAHKLGRT